MAKTDEVHICTECEHAFWSGMGMSDTAKCRKTRREDQDAPYVNGVVRDNEYYDFCGKKRGTWATIIKRLGEPSPTCPDYELRQKRKRRWWLLGFRW